jgi:hypothetical protein
MTEAFGLVLALLGGVLLGATFFGGLWERLLVCLLGFVIARLFATRFIRAAEKPAYSAQVVSHAP